MESHIENLVFSGGGHNILAMFGAISYLKKENYIDFTKIKTIDATSAGSLISFIFMITNSDDDIERYLIERPWEKVFDMSPDIIFQAFKNKGVFDIEIIEAMIDPLIKSSDFERTITFKELYDTNGIDFSIYVTELNKLELIRMSYETTPNDSVIEAIYKSCAFPPLFKPIIEDNCCYLDGGIFANYPLDCFFERMKKADIIVNEKNVFGIKLIYENTNKDIINEQSNITDYIFCMIRKLINRIVIHKEQTIDIPNELLIYSKGMSYDTLKNCIISSDQRKFLINEGKRYASVYYTYKMKESN